MVRSGATPSPHSDFIHEMLADEMARKASIEQRSSTVTTSASGLTILLVTLLGVLYRRDGSVALPTGGVVLLVCGTVLLILGAVLGLMAAAPRRYPNTVDESYLYNLLKPALWDEKPDHAFLRIAKTRVDIVIEHRNRNDAKTRMLTVALVLEVAGAIVVATAVPVFSLF